MNDFEAAKLVKAEFEAIKQSLFDLSLSTHYQQIQHRHSRIQKERGCLLIAKK